MNEGIMTSTFLITTFFPCLFVVMSLFFFAVGLRGIATKKPFVISSRWPLGLVLLGFAPSILQPFLFPTLRLGDDSGMLALLPWLTPVIFIVLAVFMCFTLRGYMAFAVTDASFREGLLASLKKLDLPHEETLAALRLPSVGADLQVAVQSWIGIGQLKMKQRKFGGLLKDISKGMNEYYQSSTVPVNLTCCIFYALMGVIMIVFAGVFVMGFGKLT